MERPRKQDNNGMDSSRMVDTDRRRAESSGIETESSKLPTNLIATKKVPNGGALDDIADLTAHDDIDDAVAKSIFEGTNIAALRISVTKNKPLRLGHAGRTRAAMNNEHLDKRFPEVADPVDKVEHQNNVSMPETRAVQRAEIPSTHVVISRKLLCVLVVASIIGMVLGTAGFLVGLVGLLGNDEEYDLSSPRDSQGPTMTNLTENHSLLDTIYERGFLKCGLAAIQPGFFFQNGVKADGRPNYVGFDVDLCSALAAAVVGEPDAYEVHSFPYNERWKKLNSTEVDLVFRSTYNMERDVYLDEVGTGFEFSTPYFYDGLGFGGLEEFVDCAESRTTNGTCANLRICGVEGTTFKRTIDGLFPPENVVSVSEEFFDEFPSECNVLASEKIQVSEESLRLQGYHRANYVSGNMIISKEPVSMVSRHGDRRWTDFIEMVLQSIIYAEQQSITRVTASKMVSTGLFGPNFEAMFKNAVAARGNYGEIYSANLENFLPRSGLNLLNSDGSGGSPLIWSFPFGNLRARGPALEEVSPTVRAIKDRGFLRCGTTQLAGFADLDPVTRDFAGLDVDLCRAISAALFDGVDRTLFADIGYRYRWENLQNHVVDLLALSTTWNLPRDVKEPSTQTGFSFSDPYIYVWHSYGGHPDFVECAENLDVASPECQALKVCVDADTTSQEELLLRFQNEFYLVPVVDSTEAANSLREGVCNVYYSTIVEAQEWRIRSNGYGHELPYMVGSARFSVEPFSVVTREDDPMWSDFVRWILWALVYAEENGITKTNAHLMPATGIFGPYRTKAFFHAVGRVGNYGELYERTMESEFQRSGPNQLNNNMDGRIYSIPGFAME